MLGMIGIKGIVIGIVVIAVLGAGTWWSVHEYNKGADAVTTKSLENYNKIEGKTNAAKTDALTTPNVDDQLRKFSSPDDTK